MQLTSRSLSVWAFCAILCAVGGWKYAVTISSSPPPVAGAVRTIHDTRVTTRIERHVVSVRVPAKIIRRYDHVIVWRTARYVFIYRGERHVIPAHVVRVIYRKATSSSPPEAAVLGVSPTPVTVTVPVTVSVPVTSVSVSTQTVTLPQETTTVTVPTVTTVTVPLPEPAPARRNQR